MYKKLKLDIHGATEMWSIKNVWQIFLKKNEPEDSG